jgi:glycosyltransferase involved in cell wall biosynthesis/tetratricopeptide (TPR) repeat protein
MTEAGISEADIGEADVGEADISELGRADAGAGAAESGDGAVPEAAPADVVAADTLDAFDLHTYRLLNLDLAHMSDQELRAHWVGFGRGEGRAYDLGSYLRANPDIATRLPPEFSVAAYKQLNPDLDALFRNDIEFIVHFLQHGYAEGRAFTTLPAPRHDGATPPFTDAMPDSERYATVQEMLTCNGILSDRFLALFDKTGYFIRHRRHGVQTEDGCLLHFCEHGRAALEPIAPDYEFDPEFYAEIAPQTAGMTPDCAYLSWLNEGLGSGLAPNPRILLRDLGLQNLARLPRALNPAAYQAANADCVPPGRWSALRHMVEMGVRHRLRGCEPREDFTDLYLAVADRLTLNGELDAARDIYERALTVNPSHAPTLQHYGDCQMRRANYFAAATAYRRILETGKDNIWTHRNLADALWQQKDELGAARVLSALALRMPGDENLRRRAEEAAARAFSSLSQEASWLAEQGFYSDARDRMGEAVDVLARHYQALQPAETLRAPRGIRSVLLVGETSLAQCHFYRIQQKQEQLKAAGVTAVFIAHDALDRINPHLATIDAAIFYRLPATPSVVRAIAAARRAGLPSFYEIDDAIYDSGRYPDSFESYGGQIDRKVYGGLVTGTVLFQSAMRLCDYGIASTPTLQEDMRDFVRSGQVFLHRNALSSPHERAIAAAARRVSPISAGKAGPVRIFYGSGTRAHNEDFETLAAPALARLLRECGDAVELTIMGYLTLPPALERFSGQIRRYDPIFNPEIYWRVLSEMDINIAVLKPGFLADTKSEIKWLEAAMFGIPSVVSDTRTYREILRDGETGLLAATPKSWFTQLKRLVQSADLRKRIGNAARRLSEAEYSIATSARALAASFAAVSAPGTQARPLKVLLVNVFFPPQAIGGATRAVADNARDLRQLAGEAIEIEVFTTTEGGAKPYGLTSYRWEGIKVVAATASNSNDVDTAPCDERMADVFDQFLAHSRPDLVHFHCIQRLSAAICGRAAARGIPYVITVHDGWWISDRQFLLDRNLEVACYDYDEPGRQLAEHGPVSYNRMQELHRHLAAAERVLAVSSSFAKIYGCTRLSNIITIENGVSDIVPLPRQPDPEGCVRLLYAGGTEAHKGYPLLRAAFHRSAFHRLKLTVIDHGLGPGASRTDLWGTTPVVFIGKTPQAEVAQLYARHDVLIAPSLWPESYGLVAREATLCGCWVVASDRGAMAGEITPETGFAIDVGTAGPLREVLARIDAAAEIYARPIPGPVKPLRTSRDQAAELLALYRDIVAGRDDAARDGTDKAAAHADRGAMKKPAPRPRDRRGQGAGTMARKVS